MQGVAAVASALRGMGARAERAVHRTGPGPVKAGTEHMNTPDDDNKGAAAARGLAIWEISLLLMATLPPDVNLYESIVLPLTMPFLGRG